MIRKIFINILLLFSFLLFSFINIKENSDPQQIYRDLGSYRQEYNDGSILQVDAYIIKKRNNSNQYSKYLYEYQLTLVSKSQHNGYYTQTWLYGCRFTYNGNEISYNQYPNGATLYISTSPTAVYSWYTSEEEIAKFMISWSSAVYEPRVR